MESHCKLQEQLGTTVLQCRAVVPQQLRTADQAPFTISVNTPERFHLVF